MHLSIMKLKISENILKQPFKAVTLRKCPKWVERAKNKAVLTIIERILRKF